MASALIGRLDPYESSESWTSYQERLEQYFLVNDIADEKKTAALLTLLGEKSYGLLRNLTSPDKPSTKTFKELCDLLQAHLSPKPIVIAERFRFHKRNQVRGESVNDYMAVLRKLSEHCQFGTALNDTLRDRFVCGLNDETTQKKLLSMEACDLKKAIDVARAMETATKDAAELQSSTSSVNKVFKSKKQGRVSVTSKPKASTPSNCIHCGRNNHESAKCRLKDAICHFCKNKGHIQKICLKAKKNRVNNVENDNDQQGDILYVNSMRSERINKITVKPQIDGKAVEMEVDTGAAATLIPIDKFRQHFGDVKLDPPRSTLKTYSGETLSQAGCKEVNVTYNGQNRKLTLCVVNSTGPILLGRDWLRYIRLDWNKLIPVHNVNTDTVNKSVDDILKKHQSVFEDGIGHVKGIRAKLVLKENATPKFMKARPVAYSLKPKVERELDNLERQGIISKVKTSNWATPVVPVVKSNGDVRICGDFKATVNPQLEVEQYPLPRAEDVFANLSNGQKFSKLDLRQAYLTLECEEESKDLLTINTLKGLYRFNRLVYGISSGPSIWQRTMDQILQGIPGVQCILDDMVVTGSDDAEHLENLDRVLGRLAEFGLRVNRDKCAFLQDRITYCGHVIDKQGLWKCDDKINAVLNTPRPTDVRTLRAYLGLLNYYHRFLPDLATVVKPMHELLEKQRKFVWSKECDASFERSKQLLTSQQCLTHFDPRLPLLLATDASPWGISGILSHIMPDGQEKPIAFASKSLSKTQLKYSQLDKESTAIHWAVNKFYAYLYGRKFTLITDCQPLTAIFNPHKSIPVTAAARLQRYAIFLSGFDYDIRYKSTKQNSNVDALSRLPVKSTADQDEDDECSVYYTSQIDQLPVSSAEIARETRRDKLLSRVYEHVATGWPPDACVENQALKPYFTRRNELSIHQGVIMWGCRVVVPIKLRSRVLQVLHTGHLGIVKTKGIARSYVFWPGIDSELEQMIKRCHGCQMQKKAPTQVNVHPWEWPTSNWERIHIDYAGPFLGRMFLVVVDAHSKWPEVVEMQSTTAEKTIQALRTIFGRNGLPRQICTDNGNQFTSQEWADFMKANGIVHYRTSVAKPSTNGQVERFNSTFKSSLRAMNKESGNLNAKLNSFLLSYRNAVHATTGESPAKMFLGRNLRSRLDLVKPDTKSTVQNSRMKMAMSDAHKFREIDLGQTVLVRDYRPTANSKWVTGTIISRDGNLMYKIDIGNGQVWRRHIDQIVKSNELEQSYGARENITDSSQIDISDKTSQPLASKPSDTVQMPLQSHDRVQTPSDITLSDKQPNEENKLSDKNKQTDLGVERRYPTRVRTAPDRLGYN